MSHHNTQSCARSREVVWEGDGERVLAELKPDGRVCLMRVSDVDDGPTRSIVLKPDAIPNLANWLFRQAFGHISWQALAELTVNGQAIHHHEEVEEMHISASGDVTYAGPRLDYGCAHDEFPGIGR
jgi:hypothetical protein